MSKIDRGSQKEIVQKAQEILDLREEAGFEAARELWRKLDRTWAPYLKEMPTEILNLMIELEFLIEDHNTADINETRRALYLAKVYLQGID